MTHEQYEAKVELQRSFPVLLGFLSNPLVLEKLQQQGKVVDFEEVVKCMFDLAEWKNDYELFRQVNKG